MGRVELVRHIHQQAEASIEQYEDPAEFLDEFDFTRIGEHPEHPERPWIGRKETGTPFGARRIFVVPNRGLHKEPHHYVTPELEGVEETKNILSQLPRQLERICVMKYEGYWGFECEDLRYPTPLWLLKKIESHEVGVYVSRDQTETHVLGMVAIPPSNFVLDVLGVKQDDAYVFNIMRRNMRNVSIDRHLASFSVDSRGLLRLDEYKYEGKSVLDIKTTAEALFNFSRMPESEDVDFKKVGRERESAPYKLKALHNAAEILYTTEFVD